MKYRVKLRKTIVTETFVEIEVKPSELVAPIVAMNISEVMMEKHPINIIPDTTVTESKWVAIAVDEIKE